MPNFERYGPRSHGLNASDLNQLIELVSRQAMGRGIGVPGLSNSAGGGFLPRPDVMQMFLIQVSAVTTVATGTVPTVPAYDWIEVVRNDGVYAAPGDGRSGTAATFPAFDSGMASNVPLNSGSTTSAYLAWLAWDQKSIEFIGIDSTAANGGSTGGGGGGGGGFIGALVTSIVPIDPFAYGDFLLRFDTVKYDTSGFFDAAVPHKLTIPAGISGHFVFGATVACGPVVTDDFAYSYIYLRNAAGVDKNTYAGGQAMNLKVSTIANPGGDGSIQLNYTTSPCEMSPTDYGTVYFLEYKFPAGAIIGYRGFWCYKVG